MTTTQANSGPIEVQPRLPDPVLPNADWADAFEITTPRTFATMKALAEQTVGAMPRWAEYLLWLRNSVVAPFGLKSDGKQDATADTNIVGIFPILEETEDRIVLGLNDRHLDFRILIEQAQQDKGTRIRTTTLVQRHNAFGKLYIAVVFPFHKAIVAAVVKQAI